MLIVLNFLFKGLKALEVFKSTACRIHTRAGIRHRSGRVMLIIHSRWFVHCGFGVPFYYTSFRLLLRLRISQYGMGLHSYFALHLWHIFRRGFHYHALVSIRLKSEIKINFLKYYFLQWKKKSTKGTVQRCNSASQIPVYLKSATVPIIGHPFFCCQKYPAPLVLFLYNKFKIHWAAKILT